MLSSISTARRYFGLLALLWTALHPISSFAWGYKGHRVVGSIADQLLTDNAKQHVAQILGFDLKTAGPWLDCVKAVMRKADGTFSYTTDPNHPEYEVPCTSFRTPDEQQRMEDYVARNWMQCSYMTSGVERGCHNTYHFDDVAVQRDRFDRNYQGTNDHDLVAAMNAAIAVLLGRPSPRPFAIKDKKEALFVLSHLVGDLHQPLHIGAVYLDSAGRVVDPDVTHTVDPATETAGGNLITDDRKNFHGEWDAIPGDLGEAATPELLTTARGVPADHGRLENWPANWATDTLLIAQEMFSSASYAPSGSKWTITFPDRDAYLRQADGVKRRQLAKAGARLAEVLNAIWP
ncbi:S1/P1 nuclease [Bradyrhizobium vignae]|uniref:S1/P1 nuclease n=1 Tax=Bradyrhizobium vignae TaxID=1549949 RepID=A0ABS4A4M7_9BRAD|nr:S1/P1 nuclease [Bradyrhizobium vignae]MBP0114930.1 S1/P1 nuclease [Bradyrhizobium vignae]